jgi:molybdopterin molybdotransferase
MMGLSELHLPILDAVADEDIKVAQGLTEFVRCTLSNHRVRTTGSQSSGALRSMSLGDALLVSPPGRGQIKSGDAVRVMVLSPQDRAEPAV